MRRALLTGRATLALACVLVAGCPLVDLPPRLDAAADAAVDAAADAKADVAKADVGTPDAGATDLGATDVGTPDTGPVDVGVMDADRNDTGPIDTGLVDTGPLDSGSIDSGPIDSGPLDTGPLDTGPLDTGPLDTGPPPACPVGMQLIPAGMFIMGDPSLTNSGPLHGVYLDAYCIGRTEVTVFEYGACTAPGCTTPGTGGLCNWTVSGRENHPINCVNYAQSRAYCQWLGGDLVTEAQWEYAARGNDSRRFPWGNAAPNDSLLCWNRVPTPNMTCPVGSFPAGVSFFGLFDMAGNVNEWNLDWSDSYTSSSTTTYQPNPMGPATGTVRSERGGSIYDTTPEGPRSAARHATFPNSGNTNLGIRCTRPPQ